MFGRGKRKEGSPIDSNPPIDAVSNLRQQGYSDEQIIPMLQNQGYASSQIFDALNQLAPANQFQQMPPNISDQPYQQQMPPMQPLDQPPMDQQPYPQNDRIEEIAEAIIDEKWNELSKNINKVIEWKERTEAKLARMDVEIKQLKDNFELLHKSILGKISEYDKNIADVGTGISAMEKVFQKIIPTLTENVNKLSRITEGIDKKQL